MDYLSKFVTGINDAILEKKELLAKGTGIGNFADYKRIVGQHEGLMQALGILNKFLEKEADG